MDNKNKANIDALWAKYQKTLEMLNDALEQLEQKPKEVERIVEVERVVEVPVTEWVEVPVEKIKDISEEERRKYLDRIAELEHEIKDLKQGKSYWGNPKLSKKIVDDNVYQQQTEQRYAKIVKEIKAGKLDINMLSDSEQIIVQRILDNE